MAQDGAGDSFPGVGRGFGEEQRSATALGDADGGSAQSGQREPGGIDLRRLPTRC